MCHSLQTPSETNDNGEKRWCYWDRKFKVSNRGFSSQVTWVASHELLCSWVFPIPPPLNMICNIFAGLAHMADIYALNLPIWNLQHVFASEGLHDNLLFIALLSWYIVTRYQRLSKVPLQLGWGVGGICNCPRELYCLKRGLLLSVIC